MVTVEVTTIWKDRAGIPEKYYEQALKNKEDLKISFKNGIMKILYPELKERRVGRSEKPFQDKFGRGEYYLVYFIWKPMNEDEEMEEFSKNYL